MSRLLRGYVEARLDPLPDLAKGCEDHLGDQADAYQAVAAKLICIPPGEGDSS